MKVIIKAKASMIADVIKMGLAMVIPILFVGSITVLLNSFPVQAYQDFLDSFLGGALRIIISVVQKTTVGALAVYITIALSISYMNKTEGDEGLAYKFGSILSCLTGFFVLVGFFIVEPDTSLLSGQGVFSALLAGIIGSALYRKFVNLFKIRKRIFVDGANAAFNAGLQIILPFVSVVLCFVIVNYLITVCFQVDSVQHLFMKAVDAIFLKMHRSYSSGLLFNILISVMWWFGIHGNNVLNQVAEDMFTEIIPGEIVSKSFMDTFVIMGGTGCLIGLLIAMIIFGKRSSTKKLSKMAFVPCLFNISELLVFGLPVIYNPLMIIPFILSPVLCYTSAYLLTMVGFLPEVVNEVVWTTPPIMSGYLATGSVRGIIVQLINIAISVACYAPFVILYEKKSLSEFSPAMDELIAIVKRNEESGEDIVLTEYEGNVGRLAKELASDFEDAVSSASPEMEYDRLDNPLMVEYKKVDYVRNYEEGDVVGESDSAGGRVNVVEEAVLTWQHARYRVVYPPLVACLAKESGNTYELETYVIEKAVFDAESSGKFSNSNYKLIVNVSESTLISKKFEDFLQKIAMDYKLRSGKVCIKLSSPELTDEMKESVDRIMGYGYDYFDK